MNKYHYLNIFIIGILSLLIVIIGCENIKMNSQLNIIKDKIERFDQYYKLIRYRDKEVILNNGTKLHTDLILTDENKDTVNLSRILAENGNFPTLIIKISALGCDMCFEEEFKLLSNYISNIGVNNVKIFVSDYNIRSIKVLAQSLKFDLKIYQTPKVGIPFEENNHNLFVFILDNELIIKDFFIPEKTLPDLSKDYYKSICDKYLWQ